MITFDKIKLVADISAVERFDETRFEKTEKDGKYTYNYYQETPCLLVIKVDYRENEVVIEFTGNYWVQTILNLFHQIQSISVFS